MSVIFTGKVDISPNAFKLNKPPRIFNECGIQSSEIKKTPIKLTILLL